MICASSEIGLEEQFPQKEEREILDLSAVSALPGTPVAHALCMDDVIFHIDNKALSHRPDLWGHLGLARELAAIWQAPLRLPEPPALAGVAEVKLKVIIEASEHYRRYLGVVVAGLKVAESPAWL